MYIIPKTKINVPKASPMPSKIISLVYGSVTYTWALWLKHEKTMISYFIYIGKHQ